MRRFATVGVYGFDAESFLETLHAAGVDLVLDIRQRRAVRGAQFAWANAHRLQAALSDNGIGYRHWLQLAPTTALRQTQYRADAERGEGKRSRTVLAAEYVEGYRREILAGVDLAQLVARLPENSTSALMCVERDPQACHRSLVAVEFERLGIPVAHLQPSESPQ